MYCLEKLQRELAYFLDIDLRDLPKVQEILKAQGYTAVKKNDEIIELGNEIQNLRDELITNLTPILNKDITNISSGITAQVSKTSIKKMGSDKAINKSIENGFSLQEHFKASADIENLYKKATNIATTKDLKNGDPAIQIHTFISQVNDNANAKILVKESLDKDSRRIYTLELESLESAKPLAQVPNGDLADHLTKSKQKSDTSLTPLENVSEIIPQPNKQTFQAYKQSLESQGIPIENEVKSFINFVEKNIYNENGVSFNQLNNALKTLNSYYKEAKDPNFKNHIKNAMDSFLREDIKAGIEAIFSQNKSAYKDISSLYATALSDYADMKEVLKIADKLKIRNATTEQNKALDSLLKLAKGQGDKLDNISSLTKALDKDNRALIELNMLSGLFQKSLYDENALQVIDSGKFFKELQALHKDTFQSKEAQDFINIMSDFDRLFKNDILIAKALKPTTTGQIGSSIATSIEGAVKFQMVKNAFSHLVRLMPHIPFMSGLNQKVQGAALRYHLQKALESSFSVSELKHTLQNRIAKAPYTSQTKSQIEKILNRVDTIQDELIEVAERNAKQAQNAKDLQEYQTLQKYGVESLEKLSQDDFNHFVDSVLSGDIEALKSAPNIVYIADLNAELAKELGLNNGKIFLRKNDLHHFRPERKVEYDQAVPREIIKEIPNIINNTPLAYKDPLHNNFFITKELNQVEVMKIAINKDSEGNYIITLSKVEKSSIENQGLEAVGLAPTIPNLNDEAYRTTMLPPSTSKPSDIIPQNPTKAQSSLESAPQKVDSSDIIFTDKKGKEHTLTKEVQEQWLNTFNLKSLDEAYTPKFSDEVSKALEPILQGEQIKLTSGSLLKLMQRDRLEFLPYIKDTLEYSDIVIKDKENALIFAKDIGQTSYFTSVSKNDKGEWVISTNSYKTINQLKNRVNDSGEILYISKEAPNILAETFTTKAFSNELASDIIPQQTLESTMKKFNYDERKAKDLLEWHKDSSPLTKDENGVPKVFYHGSETDKPFEVFLSEKDQTKWGFWFSSNADDADLYARARGNQAGKHGYEVFLKAKNIFDFNDEKNLEVLKKIFSKEDYEFMLDDLQKWGKEINVFNMLRDTNFDRYRSKAEVFKNELKKLGYDGIKELGDTIVVFDSNQIKHIDNKGVDGKFFNESSPNIYQSNAHIGSGLVGGSVAGIESDENGNLTFSPEKFVLGLLGGAIGSKAVTQGFKYLKENPQVKEAVVKELADTLALGFDKARQKYPLLSLLEPRYIVQNERGRIVQAKAMISELEKKEQKGIYNVAYNGKNAVLIQKDLRAVDEALKLTQGYHLEHSQKGKGAKHIKIEHLQDSTKEGYVTDLELVNLGKDLRTFLKDYEPFVEKQKSGQEARIYEWENKEGVRFRLVSKIQGGGTTADSHLESAEEIITFYSDRNLKDKMQFKNPILKV